MHRRITAATVNKTGIEAVCVANVIKYLWRYEIKNGVEDVRKAQWYLNRLVAAIGKPKECNHEWVQTLDSRIKKCASCGRVEDIY